VRLATEKSPIVSRQVSIQYTFLCWEKLFSKHHTRSRTDHAPRTLSSPAATGKKSARCEQHTPPPPPVSAQSGTCVGGLWVIVGGYIRRAGSLCLCALKKRKALDHRCGSQECVSIRVGTGRVNCAGNSAKALALRALIFGF
jgi:hypothetical protein